MGRLGVPKNRKAGAEGSLSCSWRSEPSSCSTWEPFFSFPFPMRAKCYAKSFSLLTSAFAVNQDIYIKGIKEIKRRSIGSELGRHTSSHCGSRRLSIAPGLDWGRGLFFMEQIGWIPTVRCAGLGGASWRSGRNSNSIRHYCLLYFAVKAWNFATSSDPCTRHRHHASRLQGTAVSLKEPCFSSDSDV